MDAIVKSDEDLGSPSDSQVTVAVDTFRLLADPTRLRLLWALADGAELDVSTLAEMLGVPQPATSQHLARLRLSGAVDVRKDGRRSLYSIRGVHLRRVISEALFHADHTVTGEPPHN
ncbi:metalloregulator ArsR/SmtB family transcription factor [Kribbella sp. NPDC023855]|uniref:ArsR/SmtB family transcription factor n=1 Tax=Kribbella sp. NPDC023855 TaxID=3154698 RepID=UPI0033DEFB4D